MEEKKICFVDLYKEFLVFQKKNHKEKKTMAFLFFFFFFFKKEGIVKKKTFGRINDVTSFTKECRFL